MIPTLVDHAPTQGLKNWIYEVKYDGFRCLLYIDDGQIDLISRNLINMSNSFPEIIIDIKDKLSMLSPFLPIVLDGELVILDSNYRANFEKIQVRGRTKADSKIQLLRKELPAHYLAFDVIMINGVEVSNEPLCQRKERLYNLFRKIGGLDHSLTNLATRINIIKSFQSIEETWSHVVKENGEGIVAKKTDSKWIEGIRTSDWLKIKNWKQADFIITSIEKKNGYFHVGLVKNGVIVHAGLFSHGLSQEEREALQQTIRKNSSHEDTNFIYINPSICVQLKFLDWYKDELRQPRFSKFQLDKRWENCTWEEARIQSMRLS